MVYKGRIGTLRSPRAWLSLMLNLSVLVSVGEGFASENCQRLTQGKLNAINTDSPRFKASLLLSGKPPIDCEEYNHDMGEYTCDGIKVKGDQIRTKDGETLRYGLTNYKQYNECSDSAKGLLIRTIRSWEGKIFETSYYMKFRSIIYTEYIIDNPIF
jgi:hypothetical protein